MKQLLFLLLFPCLAMAQYTGNAGQKITLGEQTTADGLVFRGVLNDTALITPFSDTSAYIILDTVNNRFYNYNRNTNVWTQLNILPTDTASMLGNYWRSGKFSGVLPVANGGTGQTTLAAAGINTGSGTLNYLPKYTATGTTLGISSIVDNGSSISSTSSVTFDGVIAGKNTLTIGNGTTAANSSFSLLGVPNVSYTWSILNNGDGLSFSPGTTVLKLNGDTGAATFSSSVTATTGTFSAVGAGAYANDLNITSTGALTTASSDEKYKYNILPINYGLNTILQLKPVNFQWIKGEENDLGFIAQDVADIIPEAVDTNWNSDLLMRYESIIPILTKAIQEQQSLIKALEQRILNLENK